VKIHFEDKSYVEVVKSSTPGKVFITIAARDAKDTSIIVAHSVEITEQEFQELIKLSN
jgi:copper(I)-binding protein